MSPFLDCSDVPERVVAGPSCAGSPVLKSICQLSLSRGLVLLVLLNVLFSANALDAWLEALINVKMFKVVTAFTFV